MIIDSHAHYAHFSFDKEAPRLCTESGGYSSLRLTRDELIEMMRERGIVGVIEPSIEFENIEKQLDLATKYGDFFKIAVGVHPTRCIRTDWEKREQLESYAANECVIAIGETGLDYHYKRKMQQRELQKAWFSYQLELAHRLGLPLVLHVRDADRDALRILRKSREHLHGGVAHCFTGRARLAKKYTELGFVIGIGGKLLGDDREAKRLEDAVKKLPLDKIVVETDAPLVIPKTVGREVVESGNQFKKLSNSSLILPLVIERIAELRGESVETVSAAVYENTLRCFGIEFMKGGEENDW